ncbi:uncharacterized protein LOC129769800 [Toxorhynchites rutilus septentrionalis]|uniref:uncharacterized protein LOC129769800 n=1 Tax=Toxorhynchites rutilus septentrionalis TaxID=329112 RepID=UPI0024786F82|nr:uncharacterized protein LOC129769800 [Toxorhynchites rutilus septentrionalis]
MDVKSCANCPENMQVGRNLLEADSEQSAKFKSRIVCVVPGCKQRYRPGISVYVFPPKTDKSRYLDWIQRLRLKIEPTKTSRICSLHFTVSNFYSPTTSRATDRLILRPSAVPDMNLPQPPISEARKRLIEDRAERVANRAKVGAVMDQRHDTPNLSDLAIRGELITYYSKHVIAHFAPSWTVSAFSISA